jgi:hypothetical protein
MFSWQTGSAAPGILRGPVVSTVHKGACETRSSERFRRWCFESQETAGFLWKLTVERQWSELLCRSGLLHRKAWCAPAPPVFPPRPVPSLRWLVSPDRAREILRGLRGNLPRKWPSGRSRGVSRNLRAPPRQMVPGGIGLFGARPAPGSLPQTAILGSPEFVEAAVSGAVGSREHRGDR